MKDLIRKILTESSNKKIIDYIKSKNFFTDSSDKFKKTVVFLSQSGYSLKEIKEIIRILFNKNKDYDDDKHKIFLERILEFKKHLKKIMEDDHPCNYGDSDEYANIMIDSSILETFDLTWDNADFLDDFELKDSIKQEYYDGLVKKYEKEKCD